MRAVVNSMAGWEISDDEWDLVVLPARMGGIGPSNVHDFPFECDNSVDLTKDLSTAILDGTPNLPDFTSLKETRSTSQDGQNHEKGA
eukprot:NODE_3285_length_951_cov_10.492239_g2731_i0.p3 GENE.NODE_3285_length_951_cov_10.492239_g2731_i0~~NODE_3285_length_951_cov_10.492239_g2731_i0.p3  ORF type:complete len:87 (-),score=17.94 NODE_3285_length_951_cov_10.492239_g2731_i0:161-421(-)